VAKHQDRATSDVDLVIVSAVLGYPDVFAAMERVSEQLGRPVNPTIYTPSEFSGRAKQRNSFVSKVLKQPKIWIIGAEDDLAAG
jgi:hypothetical protein